MNCEELFDCLDVNKDGVIDYDEFINSAYDRVQLLNAKNLEFAFNIIDKNKDRSISSEELQQTFGNGVLETLTEKHDIQVEETYWQRMLDKVD